MNECLFEWMNECFPAAGMNLIVLWLCGFSVFKDYFSSFHEGVWMRGSLRSSQVLRMQVILTIKNPYEITPLEVVAVGARGERVPPCLGQWLWTGRHCSLLALYVLLSLATLVLFPAHGVFPRVVDLWGLQISRCAASSYLSLGYFSRGKGNNFLKFLWMWKKSNVASRPCCFHRAK